MLCDTIARGLVDSAKKIDLDIGKDFDFLFVSIDPSDSPDAGEDQAEQLCGGIRQAGLGERISFPGRHGNEIKQLATAVGFRYQPAQNGQFAHPAVAMVITPDGKIADIFIRNRRLSVANAAAVAGRRRRTGKSGRRSIRSC